MMKKNLLFIAILAFALSACDVLATPTAQSSVPNQHAKEMVSDEFISVGLIANTRLAPIHPFDLIAQSSNNVFTEYQKVVWNESTRWPVATISGSHEFLLHISTLAQKNKIKIKFGSSIQIAISQADGLLDEFMVVIHSETESTETRQDGVDFPTIPLKIDRQKFAADNTDEFKSTGDEIYYVFSFECLQSGYYMVDISIPYFVSDGLTNKNHTFDYPVTLACPKSITVYNTSFGTGQFENSGNFVIHDGKYIPEP